MIHQPEKTTSLIGMHSDFLMEKIIKLIVTVMDSHAIMLYGNKEG